MLSCTGCTLIKQMHRGDGVTLQDVCLVAFIGLTELQYERYRVWTDCNELAYQIICQNPGQLGTDLLTDMRLLV